jgi:acyl carrier protein
MAQFEQGRVIDQVTKLNGKHASSKGELIETVIHLIAMTLGNNGGKIKPETPLFSSHGVFDSVGLLEFVLRLEDTFSISIPDEDLDPDVFQSPQTIVTYLNSRLQQDA